jgi:hypothetical protein
MEGNTMFKLVTRSVAALAIVATGLGAHTAMGASSKVASTTFSLHPAVALIPCMRLNHSTTPTATATIERGRRNDTLTLNLAGFKPGLGFDLFTIQNSNQAADGSPVQGFTNFGMAWYQSDVQINSNGAAHVTVQTILLDQIFGFDAATGLAPTNTFHLGFWFDDPTTAVGCGFSGVPTPFNGEHSAGPNAFITRPDATTNLGPLCTHPVHSGDAFVCHP